MKKVILIALYISATAHAFVAENASEGQGLEQLMGGVGQARLGSAGALGSNPALLAWLSNRKKFVSTNVLSIYRLRLAGTEGNFNVAPDIVPKLAATTEGFGNWGHSYGLIVNNVKVGYSLSEGGSETKSTSETQTAHLNYSFGKKILDSSAIGLGIHLGRVRQENAATYLGETAGFETIFVANSKSSFWTQGFSVGLATSFEDWAVGMSGKFTTVKFAALGINEEIQYSEPTNEIERRTDHKVENITIIPDLRAGVLKKFETSKLFIDLKLTPAHYDTDTEDQKKSFVTVLGGFEDQLSEFYRWYTGLAYSPTANGNKEAGILNLGLSKQGRHSVQFAGVRWIRAIRSAENNVYGVTFGTMFEY